jgi:SAM-dependent methyltransferase
VLLAWELERLDLAVTDAFGYHALQLGLPELDALRANRMPHRWVASDSLLVPERLVAPPPPAEILISTQPPPLPVSLHCEFDALPFPDSSVDLVVLPHALELARDPHHTLREVERVLVPEGRVVISGFNPVSLWGLRQSAGRARRSMGFGRGQNLYLPRAGEFIGYWRLRDWLRRWASRSKPAASAAGARPWPANSGWSVLRGWNAWVNAGGRCWARPTFWKL